MENQKTLNDAINERDNAAYSQLLDSYKGGYLDGMIVGLHAAHVPTSVISGFLNVPIKYIAMEIESYREKVKNSNEKMNEYVIFTPFEDVENGQTDVEIGTQN